MGTPYYFSPEICREKLYSYASDIWALGCILYELAALHVPFEAQNIPSLIRKITGGRLPSFPSTYSNELRLLNHELLCRDHSLRPSAVEILQNPMIQTEMRQMLNEKPTRSLSSSVSTTASRSDLISSSPPLNLGRNADLDRMPAQMPAQNAGRIFDLDSRRLLGSVHKPLAHNIKDMRKSPSAPGNIVPLPEGRPPALRQSGSSPVISSNGAIKASPEISNRVDSELKTAWGADFANDKCSRAAPTALRRAADQCVDRGDPQDEIRRPSKESVRPPSKESRAAPSALRRLVDECADRREPQDEARRPSKEGELRKNTGGLSAGGHFGGDLITNLNAKRSCISPLLGMGAPRCGANRGNSRANQRRRLALPVWQDSHY